MRNDEISFSITTLYYRVGTPLNFARIRFSRNSRTLRNIGK